LALAADRESLERHLSLVDRPPADDAIDPIQATANVKLLKAETREDAVALLTPEECARVQSVPELLVHLFELPAKQRSFEE
jgi:hypothetical protein